MRKENKYRIIFMGTPKIAATVFEALINEGYNFVGLITQEDKKVGRKNEIEFSPTKKIALEHNIPVFQPHRIRLDYEFVKELKPDLILTLAYGQIIPQGLLDIPKFGCLNLHGSILPKYRGAAPIQRAIIDGEKKTGITLMEMVDKMDAGKMFATETVDILDEDNYSSLCDKLANASIKICLEKLPLYFDGKLPGTLQDESMVSIANKIKPEEEKLNLALNAADFINYVRGLSDEPGGYLFLENKKLKIFKAHLFNKSTDEKVGTLSIKKDVFLQLKDGVIVLDIIQLEGKKKMDGRSFANGSRGYDKVILQ